MTPVELVDRLVSVPAEAPRTLRGASKTEGVSQEFFARVLRFFTGDHAVLVQLAPSARAVIRYGDVPSLGHRSLAIIELVRGRWLSSADQFVKAGDQAVDPVERLAFKRGAIRALARAGRVEQAIALGRELLHGLRDLGEEGQAGQVALNLALALLDQDRYAEALDLLEGLPAALSSSGYSADAVSARFALAIAHLFGGDVSRARQEALTAADEADSQGLELSANLARRHAAYADILRGDPDLAVASLVKLRPTFADVPVELAETLEFLGDALLAMNLWTEAGDAYREALALGSVVSPLRRAHLRRGLGETLLASGDAPGALTELRRASRGYRSLGNRSWLAAAETDRAQAERAMGLKGARDRAEASIRLARESESPYHLARALLASAEAGGSDASLDEAAGILEAHPFGHLEWRVHVERARRAIGAERLAHFRRGFQAILRDQSRLSSFASRLGFLRDKADAIRAYLDELLVTPTPDRIAEAIDVVGRSRAVALLDELLRARSVHLPAGAEERLRELRAELNDRQPEGPASGSRRRAKSFEQLDHLQRRWVEETYAVERSACLDALPPAPDSVVLIESGDRYRALSSEGIVELSPTGSLAASLEWLSYDLLTPMLDRKADPRPAMRRLCDLGKRLIGPLLEVPGTLGLCPEGTLWRVPWLACLDALDEERDLELRMHPGLGGATPRLAGKHAMLWIAEHSDLPWVRAEEEMFLHFFPDARVSRSAVEVRASLIEADVSVLHVVTHARHRWRHPMFSSLDFTDGAVVAAEIARSGLRAELVTLSGCDTGRLSDANRFEPDGLVRAFLACGAASVVGSAWPLDDEAAVRLYEAFYRSLSTDPNVHVSLRKARQAVQTWNGHPYFWASPLLYGGYRK